MGKYCAYVWHCWLSFSLPSEIFACLVAGFRELLKRVFLVFWTITCECENIVSIKLGRKFSILEGMCKKGFQLLEHKPLPLWHRHLWLLELPAESSAVVSRLHKAWEFIFDIQIRTLTHGAEMSCTESIHLLTLSGSQWAQPSWNSNNELMNSRSCSVERTELHRCS